MDTLARISILMIAVLFGGATYDSERYEVLPESRIWIDGSSTAGSYSCVGDRVVGIGRLDAGPTTSVRAHVAVPVRSFDCGMRQMNADFVEALEAGAHPAISFSLEEADWSSSSSSQGAWVSMSATGELEVAGVSRRIAFAVEGQRSSNGRVRVRGTHQLRMTDFGIEPPSGLLGLVRSDDNITVRFDLQAVPR